MSVGHTRLMGNFYRSSALYLRFSLLVLVFVLSSCGNDESGSSDVAPAVRGLKTFLVQDADTSTVRQYPSVLQPASLTVLAFELSGKISELSLSVGQSVKAGDVLAQLETTSLNLDVESAVAGLEQAKASNVNAEKDFSRKSELQKEGVVSKAELDQSRANVEVSRSQLVQAQSKLESAQTNLGKTQILAPYDGIINSVEVDPFATVSPGAPIASLYSSAAFEASFSVSFEVVSQLIDGKPVTITLADRSEVQLAGVISELGSRADTVSSFPVVITLREMVPELKAGMAVSISMEFEVVNGGGFALPFQELALKQEFEPGAQHIKKTPVKQSVYVFDSETSTVQERDVLVAGVRGNSVIVVSGLSAGERVASAGVSFLRDGQKVKLLADAE